MFSKDYKASFNSMQNDVLICWGTAGYVNCYNSHCLPRGYYSDFLVFFQVIADLLFAVGLTRSRDRWQDAILTIGKLLLAHWPKC